MGISHKTSKDLIHWKDELPVFPSKPGWTDSVVPNFRNHIWAPDISFHQGTYYVYYSISAFGKNTSAIGVATNKSLNPQAENYQWEDHGILIQSVPNRDLWNAIDPNLIIDDAGNPWLSFGSFWNGLKMVKLSKNLTEIDPSNTWYTIARRERDFNLTDADAGNAALEAPFIYKKGGEYYFFLSWDLCCRGEKSTYKVVVGRSKNAYGPFIDKNGKDLFMGGGTLVAEGNKSWFGIGHNAVVDLDEKTYFIAHAYDANNKGKPILKIIPMKFDEAGWPIQIKIEDNIAN